MEQRFWRCLKVKDCINEEKSLKLCSPGRMLGIKHPTVDAPTVVDNKHLIIRYHENYASNAAI